MHTIGIIAEYNPFHNGHIHQINTIRQHHPRARIIAVMSGSFTQRGCPAILDKWQRAYHAVLGGVDLVLELPTAFAVRSAQDFARGGVSLLARLGIADGLAFGAESSTAVLQRAAASMDTQAVQEKLHVAVRSGISYAAALSRAIAETCSIDEALLKKPNNILAIEYLRTLKKSRLPIEPLIIQRVGAAYHDQELYERYASASAIRREIYAPLPERERLAKVLPASGAEALLKARSEGAIPETELLLRPLLAELEHHSAGRLQEIYSFNEGLENRLLRAAAHCRSLEELLNECRSRRYPKSRIQRLLLHLLLRLRKEEVHTFDEAGALYARVLAFNHTGKDMLHEIKQRGTLPLVSKTSHFLKDPARCSPQERSPLENMLAVDVHATELRRFCLPKIGRHGEDFRRSPLFISE